MPIPAVAHMCIFHEYGASHLARDEAPIASPTSRKYVKVLFIWNPHLSGEDRLLNGYGRSNWLDNANFGHRNQPRKQSTVAIQGASSMRELVLMDPDHDKMFEWNFVYLLNSPNGTIESISDAIINTRYYISYGHRVVRYNNYLLEDI